MPARCVREGEPLYVCGFALAEIEAHQIFFLPQMLYEVCTSPGHMLDMGLSGVQPQRIIPEGRFFASDDGFGNLRLWGIDASLLAAPPGCSGKCPNP